LPDRARLETMEITLTPEQERFVADEIADGAFQTPEELMHALLDFYRGRKLAWLRREVQIGLDDVKRNGTLPLTPELIEEIWKEGLAELEAEGKAS
jgi:hypothetical protein